MNPIRGNTPPQITSTGIIEVQAGSSSAQHWTVKVDLLAYSILQKAAQGTLYPDLVGEVGQLAQELRTLDNKLHEAIRLAVETANYLYSMFRSALPRPPAGIAELAEWDDSVPGRVDLYVGDLLPWLFWQDGVSGPCCPMHGYEERMEDIRRRGYYRDVDIRKLLADSQTFLGALRSMVQKCLLAW